MEAVATHEQLNHGEWFGWPPGYLFLFLFCIGFDCKKICHGFDRFEGD